MDKKELKRLKGINDESSGLIDKYLDAADSTGTLDATSSGIGLLATMLLHTNMLLTSILEELSTKEDKL